MTLLSSWGTAVMKEVAKEMQVVLSPLLRHVISNPVCFWLGADWEREPCSTAAELC